MTEKLFYQDSHLAEFKATVISCKSVSGGVLNGKQGDFYSVELDRTAFFPEGGGQYADTGFLMKYGPSMCRKRRKDIPCD